MGTRNEAMETRSAELGTRNGGMGTEVASFHSNEQPRWGRDPSSHHTQGRRCAPTLGYGFSPVGAGRMGRQFTEGSWGLGGSLGSQCGAGA